jgi:ketosteroid isomerase-like protein
VTDIESVALARAAFDALARRDFDAFFELLHPDVEFTSLIAEAEARAFVGHGGARHFLDQMYSVFPDWCPTVHSAEGHGDWVLVNVRFQGTGAGSGMTIEQEMWQVAHSREGKVVWWRMYRTEEEAREALERALSESEGSDAAGEPGQRGTHRSRR